MILHTPSFQYHKDQKVLNEMKFELSPGSITSILGPSGCGKSTLLRMLMGFEKSQFSCSYSFSFVPQTSYLFPWKTLEQNIALNAPKHLNKDEVKTSVFEKLKIVGLSGFESKYPFEISVGMCQRVSFARAMMRSSDILLLDEPFSALDALTRRDLQNWLLVLTKQENWAVLFVTHDIAEAMYLSSDIYFLDSKPSSITSHFKKNNGQFLNVITDELLTRF